MNGLSPDSKDHEIDELLSDCGWSTDDIKEALDTLRNPEKEKSNTNYYNASYFIDKADSKRLSELLNIEVTHTKNDINDLDEIIRRRRQIPTSFYIKGFLIGAFLAIMILWLLMWHLEIALYHPSVRQY